MILAFGQIWVLEEEWQKVVFDVKTKDILPSMHKSCALNNNQPSASAMLRCCILPEKIHSIYHPRHLVQTS